MQHTQTHEHYELCWHKQSVIDQRIIYASSDRATTFLSSIWVVVQLSHSWTETYMYDPAHHRGSCWPAGRQTENNSWARRQSIRHDTLVDKLKFTSTAVAWYIVVIARYKAAVSTQLSRETTRKREIERTPSERQWETVRGSSCAYSGIIKLHYRIPSIFSYISISTQGRWRCSSDLYTLHKPNHCTRRGINDNDAHGDWRLIMANVSDDGFKINDHALQCSSAVRCI